MSAPDPAALARMAYSELVAGALELVNADRAWRTEQTATSYSKACYALGVLQGRAVEWFERFKKGGYNFDAEPSGRPDLTSGLQPASAPAVLSDDQVADVLTRAQWLEVRKLSLEQLLRGLWRAKCNFTQLATDDVRILIGLGKTNPILEGMDDFHRTVAPFAERSQSYGTRPPESPIKTKGEA